MSPRDIARETGVSHTTIYDLIEKGQAAAPQRRTLDKLQRWLTGPDTGRESSHRTPAGADRFYAGVLWAAERMSGEVTAMLRDARLMLERGAPAPAAPPRSAPEYPPVEDHAVTPEELLAETMAQRGGGRRRAG